MTELKPGPEMKWLLMKVKLVEYYYSFAQGYMATTMIIAAFSYVLNTLADNVSQDLSLTSFEVEK